MPKGLNPVEPRSAAAMFKKFSSLDNYFTTDEIRSAIQYLRMMQISNNLCLTNWSTIPLTLKHQATAPSSVPGDSSESSSWRQPQCSKESTRWTTPLVAVLWFRPGPIEDSESYQPYFLMPNILNAHLQRRVENI